MPRKLTRQEFIDRARDIHRDKYCYDKVSYINSSAQVEIICNVHGSFLQKAGDHLYGNGCKLCGAIKRDDNKRKTTEWFISRAIAVHGLKYDYGESFYTTAHQKIKISCKDHGAFSMIAYAHMAGQGCSKCADYANAKIRTKPFAVFLAHANLVHGCKYYYDEESYRGDSRKLGITCRAHGLFLQSPNSHLKGRGCPKCAKSGFDNSKLGATYLLVSESLGIMKVGISNQLHKRIARLKSRTPFHFALDCCCYDDGAISSILEKHFHSRLESASLRGFDGATEWFKYDQYVADEIRSLAIVSSPRAAEYYAINGKSVPPS